MNIELTKIEAEVLAGLLETNIKNMEFGHVHYTLLLGIKKKTNYIPKEDYYTEGHPIYQEGLEIYSHSNRWGK